MAGETGISWADATFNPWIGCTAVSKLGCGGCYAEAQDSRRRWDGGRTHFGAGVPRYRTSASNWRGPLTWDRAAAADGRPRWVFCASLADVFDNEVDPAWRADLWALARATRHLRWIFLTKRVGNARRMLPADWPCAFPHCGLMATVVTQSEADRDVPKLLRTPARWHGLSIEPQAEMVVLRDGWLTGHDGSDCPASDPGCDGGEGDCHDACERPARLEWVIDGGMSGPKATPLDPAWPRALRDQCAATGTPFHFKQWGEFVPTAGGHARVGVKAAGWLLDGVEHRARPRVYG